MSGGVDSSVAAALLIQQGYEVVGFHMHFWSEENYAGTERITNKCCSIEALETARKIAHQLGIPFYVVDYSKQFKKSVVDYFLEEYRNLRTPNPCVACNKFIKFGHFLDQAQKLGCDFVATGHYARIAGIKTDLLESERPRSRRPVTASISSAQSVSDEFKSRIQLSFPRKRESIKYSGSPIRSGMTIEQYHLLASVDQNKDQSYFLWTLTQEQLAHILFPIGGFLKTNVRKMACDFGLSVFNKPESFEICFINDVDYRSFLQRHIPEVVRPGEVVNVVGKIIGKHEGLPLYTIGQRRGFLVETKTPANAPLYVVGFNQEKNQLIVGRGKESEKTRFEVVAVNWIGGYVPKVPLECSVRIRHQGELLKAKVSAKGGSASGRKFIVELDEPQRGVTPGQSAVFYLGDEVLGGGVIRA